MKLTVINLKSMLILKFELIKLLLSIKFILLEKIKSTLRILLSQKKLDIDYPTIRNILGEK